MFIRWKIATRTSLLILGSFVLPAIADSTSSMIEKSSPINSDFSLNSLVPIAVLAEADNSNPSAKNTILAQSTGVPTNSNAVNLDKPPPLSAEANAVAPQSQTLPKPADVLPDNINDPISKNTANTNRAPMMAVPPSLALPNAVNTSSHVIGNTASDVSILPQKFVTADTPPPALSPDQTNINIGPDTAANAGKPSNLAEHMGLNPDSRIKINGFLSAGAAKTNSGADYNIPGRGSVDNELNFTANTLAGLQVTGNITPTFSAVIQLVANGNYNRGNAYQINPDWVFLRYAPRPEYQFRIGRFRMPAFIYSETQEVGYSYPWIFLPNEVYRILPFENINGIDSIYTKPIGSSGNWVLKFQSYLGQSQSQYYLYTRFPFLIADGTKVTLDEDNLYGAVLSLGNQYFTVRGNYSRISLTGYIPNFLIPNFFIPNLSVPRVVKYTLFSSQPVSLWSAGLKLDYHNFIVTGEYAHRDTPSEITSLTGYYAMIGYRILNFIPNFTYARVKTTNGNDLAVVPLSQLPQSQQSLTLGLVYYINSNIDVKVGVSQITPLGGTNGLFTTNPGKKHIYLYSAAADVIF